jgi:hypothetical protein
MKLTKNVGSIDRILRIVLGIVLIGLTLTGSIGVWGWVDNPVDFEFTSWADDHEGRLLRSMLAGAENMEAVA